MPGSRRPVPAAPGRGRWAAAGLALLLAGAMVVAGRVPGAGAQAPGGLEAEFAARVTAERRAAGLGALAVEDDLVAVARKHSADMAASNRLYHNTVLGQQVQDWLVVAENVGVGTSVDQVHQALMASPTHRADILDARFTGIGVGVVESGGSMWLTQVFRRSAGATAAPPPPAPPPPRPPAAVPQPPPVAAAAPAPVVAAERPAPQPRATRASPAPGTTTSTLPVPPTTATAPVTTAPVTVAPPAAGLDLDTLAASSVPVAPEADLVAIGLLAAALLWAVGAGTVRAALRARSAPARG